jgi:hypothetical protein
VKSDKLKKLEAEFKDLERWMELGLVPKKDQPRHLEEMDRLKEKVEEESGRLKFLKQHGDLDEYVAPKRGVAKAAYQGEMPSLPDVEVGETGFTQGGNDETESETEAENTVIEPAEDGEETVAEEEDEESYFSDSARWKRGGGIIDPDANDW